MSLSRCSLWPWTLSAAFIQYCHSLWVTECFSWCDTPHIHNTGGKNVWATKKKMKNNKTVFIGVFCCVIFVFIGSVWLLHRAQCTLPVGCCGSLSSQLFDQSLSSSTTPGQTNRWDSWNNSCCCCRQEGQKAEPATVMRLYCFQSCCLIYSKPQKVLNALPKLFFQSQFATDNFSICRYWIIHLKLKLFPELRGWNTQKCRFLTKNIVTINHTGSVSRVFKLSKNTGLWFIKQKRLHVFHILWNESRTDGSFDVLCSVLCCLTRANGGWSRWHCRGKIWRRSHPQNICSLQKDKTRLCNFNLFIFLPMRWIAKHWFQTKKFCSCQGLRPSAEH